MRKLIYHVATSFDGFIAHADGSVEGLKMQGPHADDYAAAIQTYDTIIMGRATYTFGYAYGLEPGQNPYPWANSWVFSKTLDFEPTAGLNLSKGNAVDIVQEQKQATGSDIYLCGGGALAGTLADAGEIDTIVLKVNPVIFGQGISLFGNHRFKATFLPTAQKVYDNGVVTTTYQKN